jgi:DNA-directed RNA polymerase specialized sigma24 family protein
VDRETPETILIEQLNRQLLQGAVDKLPPDFREALLLCEVAEMSYREIAEILSIPIGTIMSRLTRARRAVVSHLLAISYCVRDRKVSLTAAVREKGLSSARMKA